MATSLACAFGRDVTTLSHAVSGIEERSRKSSAFAKALSQHTRSCAALVAGLEALKYEDNEKSLAELIAQVEKTIAWLNTIKPERIDGSEGKSVAVKMRDRGRLKKAQEQWSSQTGSALRHN